MTDRILKALGATDELEALRIVAEANQFLADVKAATGDETFAGALTVIAGSIRASRELAKVTEKAAEGEQVGTVLAWKSSHDQLPAARAEIETLKEAGRKRDVADLITRGRAEGKLTPATAAFWETRNSSELEAFLACAPRVIPGDAKAPVEAKGGETKIAVNGALTDADGNAYEDIKPMKRAAMKSEDSELYNALRKDWETRGKPPSTKSQAAA
jgi:hypothetical protein